MPKENPSGPDEFLTLKTTTAPTAWFRMVFLSVLGLTVLSLLTSAALATMVSEPSEEVKRLIETCSTTWKLGFGAIVGLIGGKTLTQRDPS